MSNKFSRMIREPLLQFLLIGAGIYALYFFYGAPPQDDQDRIILVTEDYVESLSASFIKRWSRPPTAKELQGLVNEYVRESLLYREALVMSLDKDDHIVRRRLAQKLEFLTNDLVKLIVPEEPVLQQYLDDNMERFRSSDLFTFTHVYIDPDKRGDDVMAYAETLLASLLLVGLPTENTLLEGDRFMLQNYFEAAPFREVQRQMGGDFADSIMQLEAGRWHGPIRSGYGLHLVFVSEHLVADDPLLADVRERVLDEYMREETEKFNAEYLDSLRQRYIIIMEKPIESAP